MAKVLQAKVIQAHLVEVAQDFGPMLVNAIARIGPIELAPRKESPFPERLCRAIAGQQLSVKAAETIWGRVVDSADNRSLMDYFAETEPETLRSCGLSAAKAKSMRAIALETQSGSLDVERLSQLTVAERNKRLMAIWGVGQWTADMMSIFYFGDPDVWPEGDVTARKTLEQLTSRRRKTIRTAARFAPYRSYLAMYMWRQADATPDVTY